MHIHAPFERKCGLMAFDSAGVTAAKTDVLQKFWKLLFFLAMKKPFLFYLNDIIILLAFKQ